MLEHTTQIDQNQIYIPNTSQTCENDKTSIPKVKSYYLEDPDVKDYCSEVAAKFLLPRKYLFGSQSDHEYDTKKRHQVMQLLAEDGMRFLTRHPLVICALMDDFTSTTQFIIIDGHHRARYSSQVGIHKLPSLVLDPPQLLRAANIYRVKNNQPLLALSQLVHQLTYEVSETLSSFRRLPDCKQPILVNGPHTLRQLCDRFPSF